MMAATNASFDDGSFIGGSAVLDFINTIGGHREGSSREKLQTYADLVDWMHAAKLINDRQAQRFHSGARDWPALASDALTSAHELREQMYRVVRAAFHGERPDESELVAIGKAVSGAQSHRRLCFAEPGYALEWSFEEGGMDALVWPISHEAADLLLSPMLSKVRECASETCGWLFVDTTKNASRRWCDMRVCGNRSKVRRHRLAGRAP